MQKLISQKFSQNIWRILPDADPASHLWVIELRDTVEKQVSFAMIDTQKQALLWHQQPEATDWWTSLTAFSYGRVYLHNYRYPEVPEPTDLVILSAANGELEEVVPNYILVNAAGEKYLTLATKAGEGFKQKIYDVGIHRFLPDLENIPEEENQIILQEPVRYMTGNIYFEKLQTFIQNKTGGNLSGGHLAHSIDYLETRPYVIFSYYIYEQDKTVQYLLIVTDQTETILHEKLSEGREGLGRSTMMLKASTLVYLKNNNEFSSLTLSK
ncbi:DUF4905 domain-containing protein [Dyadobacter luticola]|uniref:DUF4905 domain-containing protein n=1 Tax=Dyadobacter luticola TaxID=1979387 RepID=UPI0014861C38|nr:DUF4905 domain-containing protein [Dyadobacter luticola]